MAKEGVTKKLLVLLVIIVALSLVIDLLSLNILYKISKSESGLEGELAQVSRSNCESGCYRNNNYQPGLNNCLRGCCSTECGQQRGECLGRGLSATHCLEEERRCNDDCNNQYPPYESYPYQ